VFRRKPKCRHIEKRLLTLFLDDSKPGKFHITVKNEAMVDAHGYGYVPQAVVPRWHNQFVRIIISRGFLRCSFNSNGQSRASNRGTSNSTDSHAFLLLNP
jgi:hypothetical protein